MSEAESSSCPGSADEGRRDDGVGSLAEPAELEGPFSGIAAPMAMDEMSNPSSQSVQAVAHGEWD